MKYASHFSKTTASMKSSMIRELVASTKNIPDLISFAGGFPSPDTFPNRELGDIYREVVESEGRDVLQYGASEGDSHLKRQLMLWEGLDLSPDEMVITAGATNGLYYYCRALIDPADVILCESPTFLGSLVAFDALQADCQGVPMDSEGLSIDALGEKYHSLISAGRRIKFVYTIPDFQNPAGITMTLKRRRELISFCIEHELPIVEDNPYSRLRYSGESVPTLYRICRDEFPGADMVTEVLSFSKILGPGMRLAFAKGNSEMISKMVSWQQKVNITPDCVSQRVAARFLEKGMMAPHLARVCGHYKPYLQNMLSCMDRNLPPSVTWTRPEGGIFIWVWLPEGENADDLFTKAAQQKVAFIPGSKFYPQGQECYNCFRLNFTYSTPQQIETGITRLGELLRAL
jgi:2-aminoadipate transaminase